MAHGDVGQIVVGFTPAEAQAHQLGAEGIEVGGLGVDGHGGGIGAALLQLAHQGLELSGAGDQLRLQRRGGWCFGLGLAFDLAGVGCITGVEAELASGGKQLGKLFALALQAVELQLF